MPKRKTAPSQPDEQPPTKSTRASSISTSQPRRLWSPAEEAAFWAAINDQLHWSDIARRVGTRNADGCKKHWEAFRKRSGKEGGV
ncbi:hypothetical protein HDV00_003646 [Rhizophlyctis rosea]|nr:hypothetical protein HDV00_003646 [Rhizophlyctis rosea]